MHRYTPSASRIWSVAQWTRENTYCMTRQEEAIIWMSNWPSDQSTHYNILTITICSTIISSTWASVVGITGGADDTSSSILTWVINNTDVDRVACAAVWARLISSRTSKPTSCRVSRNTNLRNHNYSTYYCSSVPRSFHHMSRCSQCCCWCQSHMFHHFDRDYHQWHKHALGHTHCSWNWQSSLVDR